MSTLANILVARSMIYFLCNRELEITQLIGSYDLLNHPPEHYVGLCLLAVFPELIGNEDVLEEILAGRRKALDIPLINRTTPDGDELYFSFLVVPRYAADGRVMGMLLLAQDMTELGQLQQQLAQHRNELWLLKEQLSERNQSLAAANRELQRLDELKSAFVSITAHELRTPLTSILGFLEMLQDGDFGGMPDGQKQILATVSSSATRLLDTVNTMLDLTRIETGRLDLVLKPTDLEALVRGVITELQPQTTQRTQRITLGVTPTVPLALADRHRIAQVVYNLVENASKYSPHESEIAITIRPDYEQQMLILAVKDQGVGISAEEQKRLFAPFYRTSTVRRGGISGIGLGLHIAQSLVRLHGGHIWVDSAENEGSTFLLSLPLYLIDSTSEAPQISVPPTSTTPPPL
ncbi:MAG: PAS domain-containing protein [Anaerolineales bacterium]|nr:PAS domain-containing protein [Anaerolineales bacterium]MCB9127780.1 PAS domain-containing protein [Ardenticatenales bacterium]